MAVGLGPLPPLRPVAGLRLGTARAGLRSTGERHDLLLVELSEETRALHEYHPHAPVVCVYFLPLESCTDLGTRSTFAGSPNLSVRPADTFSAASAGAA